MTVPWAVKEAFGERLKAFVREAYPERVAIKVSGGSDEEARRSSVTEALGEQGYIRKLRRGDVEQPPPDRAWKVGTALATLSQKRWVSPVIMLFVCGYYGHVADIMINIPEKILARDRRAKMVRGLQTVSQGHNPVTTRAENRERLVREGFDELTAQEAAVWEDAMPPWERPDRELWSLDVRAYAALLAGWKRTNSGLDMTNPATATSQFITERATFAVEDREKIVVNLMVDALKP
jgi:hypothetical protein